MHPEEKNGALQSKESHLPSSGARGPSLELSPAANRPTLRKIKLDRAILERGLKLCTCPQCGVGPAVLDEKPRRLVDYPNWLVALVFLPFGTVIVAVLYFVLRQVSKVRFPLCDECRVREKRGRLIRSLGTLGVLGIPVVTLAALLQFDVSGMSFAFTLASATVAGLVSAFTAERRTRFDVIAPTRIKKKFLETKLPQSWVDVLQEEHPGALFDDD
ncbi:MAG: hypothetical protein GY822_15005 [Deltaproteobacteria bacterium]|nr:hypothetical protein [Deltaproteobacteria bacterium]